jgi:hypothetical protein
LAGKVEILERYLKEYRDDIYSIAESIGSSFELYKILEDNEEIVKRIFDVFPTIEMFYVIDKNCNKITKTFFNPNEKFKFKDEEDIEKNIIIKKFCKYIPNIDDIYIEETVILNPYTNNYVVEILIPFEYKKEKYFLTIKLNFLKYLKIIQVEEIKWFTTISKLSYGIIAVFLFLASFAFISQVVFKTIHEILHHTETGTDIAIFKSVIHITLALALIDLSKQIFQHEVLYAEDPTKHITFRKITSRFISTILIAMAIETLLLVFKASILGSVGFDSVLLMALSVTAIMLGLSLFIWVGYKTERR